MGGAGRGLLAMGTHPMAAALANGNQAATDAMRIMIEKRRRWCYWWDTLFLAVHSGMTIGQETWFILHFFLVIHLGINRNEGWDMKMFVTDTHKNTLWCTNKKWTVLSVSAGSFFSVVFKRRGEESDERRKTSELHEETRTGLPSISWTSKLLMSEDGIWSLKRCLWKECDEELEMSLSPSSSSVSSSLKTFFNFSIKKAIVSSNWWWDKLKKRFPSRHLFFSCFGWRRISGSQVISCLPSGNWGTRWGTRHTSLLLCIDFRQDDLLFVLPTPSSYSFEVVLYTSVVCCWCLILFYFEKERKQESEEGYT